MNETVKRKLNPTETIVNAIPALIEAFVTFYGEPERENITNKFKNMLVIGYCTPDAMATIINKSNTEKSTELIEEFLNKLTTKEEEKQHLEKLLFDTYEFANEKMHPINKYINYINGSNITTYNKEQVTNFINKIYPEITIDNLDEAIKSEKLQDINILATFYLQQSEKYKKYLEEIEPYDNYVKECDKLKTNLRKKYTKKLIEELKDLFTEEEYQQIQDRLNSSFFVSIKTVNAKTQNYTSYGIIGPTLIESFSKENDEILEHGKPWQKTSVKDDRIKYFKNLGINLGNNYEDYIKDSRIKELIPSKELVERVVNTNNLIYEQMMEEYYTSIPEYKKNRSIIDKEGLLDKEDGYDAKLYEMKCTAITTNLKIKDGTYIENPILFLNVGLLEEYIDSNLIHELNHVYELSLLNVTESSYQMLCGWDYVTGKISNQPKGERLQEQRKKRNYELFNEIINELISQEISEIMTQSGIYIFNTKENKRTKGGTSYERTMFLVKDFYQTYKKEIIESRKNGNISILFDKIGKENFEDLNQLFHEFNKNFSEFKIYKTYDDIKNGIVNEETKKFQSIIRRRNEILSKMEEYNNKKTSSL